MPGGAYSAVIPRLGVLLVGRTELELCNQALYQETAAADVCFAGRDAVVSPIAKVTIEGQDYILEANGESGDNKQVVIRRILKFQKVLGAERSDVLNIDDWTHLTQRIIAGDFPIIVLADSLYRPKAATTLLAGFSLEKYPRGRNYALREHEELSPITAKGYFVLDEGVIFVEQALGGTAGERKVTAKCSMQPYRFLPDDGSELEIAGGKGTGEYLAVKLKGKVYHLIISEIAGPLVSLRLESETGLLLARNFAVGNKKQFYLEGIKVEMEIMEFSEDKARIKLRRSFE